MYNERSLYIYHTTFPGSHNVASYLCLSPNDNDSPITLYTSKPLFCAITSSNSSSVKLKVSYFDAKIRIINA